MLANVKSCAVIGLDGVVVDVEVDTRSGLPAVVIYNNQNNKPLD
jgi:magnesium chelatase family protein